MSKTTETLQADVAVIGAGPGGYPAAIRLAQRGKRVVVLEKTALGGVCLNWGCIPSKAFIYAAGLYDKACHAEHMGILVDAPPRVDFARMMAWKNGIVSKLSKGIGSLFKANHIQVVTGHARFIDPTTIEVTPEDANQPLVRVEAAQSLIATGSRSLDIPGIPCDGTHVLNARQLLDIPEIPQRLAVIGGGVIGLELGMAFQKLGSTVTVIEMLPTLLSGTDPDIIRVMDRVLKKRGITALTQSRAAAVSVAQSAVSWTVETPKGKQVLTVDQVLVAVGRRPNSEDLGLDRAGVRCDSKGFIEVDAQLRTTTPHIFAVGDVTGLPFLAHRSTKMGAVAAGIMAGDTTDALDVRAMPAAVFTDPRDSDRRPDRGRGQSAGIAGSGRQVSVYGLRAGTHHG